MQLTDLSLANLAIARLGEGEPIAALGDAKIPASLWASTFLPIVKKALLASHPWAFARRSAALVEAVVDALPAGYAYAYTPPADMVTPVAIWNGYRRPPAGTELPFELVFATTAAGATKLQVIATDENPATLVYTSDALTETNDFPAPYLEALAWALAAELAMPLGKDLKRSIVLRQMAEQMRRVAVAYDRNTARRDPEPDPPSLTSRR